MDTHSMDSSLKKVCSFSRIFSSWNAPVSRRLAMAARILCCSSPVSRRLSRIKRSMRRMPPPLPLLVYTGNPAMDRLSISR